MTDFLLSHHLGGIAVGLVTFLIIGLFHPLVIKGEYYFGTRVKWAFALAGVLFLAAAFLISDIILASLAGVTAFSSFWSIKEVDEQARRVARGWFPSNPRRR